MIKIFDSNDKNFNTNGNIAINPLKLIEVKKKSLNGWYIDVEVPIKYKDYIQQDKLCVVKTKSKLRPQAFRIGSPEYTQRKIIFRAEHVMFDARNYFLVDIRPTKLNGLDTLNYINERTDNSSPFNIIDSDVEHIDTCYFIRKNLLEAWSTIEERYNGIFDADNFDISFKTTIGVDRGETIVYKKNLQNIKVFEDWSNVCTRIYPVGKDGLTLESKFIDSEIQYERPYTKTISFDTELSEEEQTQENLLKELEESAENYLKENQLPLVSYEITSDINQLMEIGDKIHVKHPIVNILTEVLEYEYNGISKKIKKIIFGNYTRDVKAKFDNIKNSIAGIKTELSNQSQIISKQTELINSLNKNGYVYINDNEILILDALPIENAKNVWRFGLGGLGFSSKGYKGPFKIAITSDGSINADFISTGKLSTSLIEGYSELLLNVSKINNQIIPTSQISGSYIHIEDSADAPLINLEIEGKSTQETRSGKNLLKNADMKGITSQGITTIVNSDGSLSVSGTSTSTYANLIDLIPWTNGAGIYTFSIDKNLNTNVILKFYNSSGAVTSSWYVGPSTKYVHITLTGEETHYRILISTTSGTAYNFQIYPMILGNVLKITATSQTINGITFTVNNDGTIKANGTATANATLVLNSGRTWFTDVGTFTLSGNPEGSSDKTYYTRFSGTNMYTDYGSGLTVIENDPNAYRYCQITVVSGVTVNNVIFKPTILYNETNYELYGVSPTPDYPSEIKSLGYENLFPKIAFTDATSNGLTRTFNTETNKLKVEGTSTAVTNIWINNIGLTLSAGTYTFSTGVVVSGIGSYRLTDLNGNTINQFSASYNTFTLTKETIIDTLLIQINSERTISNEFYFQLVEGMTLHNYSSFDKYGVEVLRVGKNKLDYTQLLPSTGGIISTINDDGSITSNGIPSYNYVQIIPTYYINDMLEDGETYTLSQKTPYDYVYGVICRTTIADGSKSYYNCRSGSYSFVVDKSKYLYQYYIQTSGTSVWGTESRTITNYYQLEKGPVATDFEKYNGTSTVFELDEPLRSLPDGTTDKLYIQNGKMYLERHIIDLALNGTENMLVGQYGTNAYKITPPLMPNNNRSNCEIMSNEFLGVSHADRANYTSNFVYVDGRDLYFRNTDFATIDEFKTYLAENNVEVQYKLATILVKTEELGKIEMPSTFKGVTNITTTDELNPNINIEYVRDTTLSSYVEGQVNNSQVIIRNEMNAKFVLQQENIDLELSKKVNNKEIIAAINMSTESLDDGSNLQIKADKIDLKGKKIDLTSDEITIESDNFSVTKEGKVTAKSGEIGGFTLEPDKFTAKISTTYTFTIDDLNKVMAYIQDEETLSDEELEKYDINGDGVVDRLDLLAMNRMYYEYISNVITGLLEINSTQTQRTFVLRDENRKIKTSVGLNGIVTPNHSCEHFTLNGIEQPQIQSGTNLPETVTDGVVFLLYSE